MPTKTADRGYYAKPLGKTRKITPEGFLLCEGVAIGRTGTQLYSKDELPTVEPDARGLITVQRLPEEVFRAESIASYEGKPVTVFHPDDMVTPETWRQSATGIIQNVRQGDGAESDLLLADLLVMSADAIAYANRELPELSSGYECDYEQVAPGHYIQRNIIGNHVAMLRRGRAGPRCAIRDHQQETSMNLFERLARLFTAIKSKDAAAVTAEIEAINVDGTIVPGLALADSEMVPRVTAIETGLAELKTLITTDQASRQAAAAAAAAAAAPTLELNAERIGEIRARAEILAPGISIPTADALAAGDAAQTLMRAALEKANGDTASAEHVKPFLMGRELKTLDGQALLGVFNGAAELARVRNNQAAARATTAKTKDFGKATAIADLNKANRDFWATQKQ